MSEKQNKWLQEQDSIKVAIYPYHPPYQIINEQGNVDGVFTEYLELIEEKIGYKFHQKIYNTWPALMEDVRKEKVDLIVEIHPTKKRKEYLNFYAFLFESPHMIVTRKKDSNGAKISDFSDKIIVLPKDYAIAEILKQKYPELNLAFEEDEITCLQKLNSGKYDAFIGPKAVVHYLIRTKNINNLKIAGETDISYKTGIAVFKKNQILNKIISRATKAVSRKEKQSILDNWIFNVVTPFYQKTIFWVFFSIGVILILLTISLINRYLKFKIKQKTQELRIAKENAENSNQLKTNFINNISHEIRTPMNGIMGFSEFLNDPNITPEERKNYTGIIIESSHQLMSIIDDIMEISKLRSKQIKIQEEETNLNDLFQKLMRDFETVAQEKNISLLLENTIPQEKSLVLIDKSKVDKILNKIIDNAIKFTTEGSVKIRCSITKDQLAITIEDTGIGINTEDQKNIFKSFSQSEKEIARTYGGLGLGLTIAKENADLIKGKILFTSTLNQGSSFTLLLAYHPIIDSNKNNMKSDPKENFVKPFKHVILIAEDGEVNFLFLKTILQKMENYKFVIHRAENGKKAVEICEENENINLVLMDIKMPIMDGYVATKKIKKLRPYLPIIAQTAYSTEEDIQRALNAGCDDFVSKPVDHKILKPMLKKYFSFFQS
ncbi:response regulator [Aquimarina sp. 2304DJ70-9]|uniref:response regulator n=1 Tax=Aquimarina penaris TaxID=3231044 RepID=UPI0034621019